MRMQIEPLHICSAVYINPNFRGIPEQPEKYNNITMFDLMNLHIVHLKSSFSK